MSVCKFIGIRQKTLLKSLIIGIVEVYLHQLREGFSPNISDCLLSGDLIIWQHIVDANLMSRVVRTCGEESDACVNPYKP